MKPYLESTRADARWHPIPQGILGPRKVRSNTQEVSTGKARCSRAPAFPHRLDAGILVILLLALPPSFALDLSSWAREIHAHADWAAVQFRDPFSGRYLFSRAGSEDPERSATLTFTASPIDACAAATVIVIRLESANSRDVQQLAEIEIAVDGSERGILPVAVIMPKGDHFAYLQLRERFDPARLADRKGMSVSMQGVSVARFSLNGVDSAWREVQSTCQGFAAP